MKMSSPAQLMSRIKNMTKGNNLVANTLLQSYMMERLLERISVSKYSDNLIIKGGFLIAAMIGLEMRSTMDMDTTIRGIPVNRETIEKMLKEILSEDLDDNINFEFTSITNIRDSGEYEDFRVSLVAHFFTIKVNMKIDITTGDVIIPREVEYSFKLMFEERSIPIKAYNLNTILAEKMESILARNVANTRARDYYDVYILWCLRRADIELEGLRDAIRKKADERNTSAYLENKEKYLKDIAESEELKAIWEAYAVRYPYAQGIQFHEIVEVLKEILDF